MIGFQKVDDASEFEDLDDCIRELKIQAPINKVLKVN